MSLVVGIATIVGASASVLALCLSTRYKSKSSYESSGTGLAYASLDEEAIYDFLVAKIAGTPSNMADVKYRARQIREGQRGAPPRLLKYLQNRQLNSYRTAQFDRTVTLGSKRPRTRRNRVVKTSVPTWPLRLFDPIDAQRYTREWGAHLYQLVEEGDIKRARIDRRRLAFAAVFLALALRVRRAFSQAQ
jgi:hypothetical protein